MRCRKEAARQVIVKTKVENTRDHLNLQIPLQIKIITRIENNKSIGFN